MSLDEHKFFYRRNLPHFQPEAATLFVTIRLYGTIPRAVLLEWQEKKQQKELALGKLKDSRKRERLRYDEWKRQFGRMDNYLDVAQYGPTWLSNPEIAAFVAQALRHFDDKRYRLDAFSILSNHAHVVLSPLVKPDGSFYGLHSIMHSLKSFTANKANTVLETSDEPFWQGESYDHVVRDEAEWQRVMMYVLNNPVKAGLCNSWDKWKWTYCKYT